MENSIQIGCIRRAGKEDRDPAAKLAPYLLIKISAVRREVPAQRHGVLTLSYSAQKPAVVPQRPKYRHRAQIAHAPAYVKTINVIVGDLPSARRSDRPAFRELRRKSRSTAGRGDDNYTDVLFLGEREKGHNLT